MKAETLKKSILQYAMQGKLVKQNPDDEPASELLKQIKSEKEQLIKDGKIKKEKSLPPITDDKIPFSIPDSWIWCRLGTILEKLTDGTHSTPKYVSSGVPFISVKDISQGFISFDNTKFITKGEHEELYKRCDPKKGDILLTKVGTTGIPVIVDTDIEFSLFVSVAQLRFNHSCINANYLKYLILSPLVQMQCKENTKGVGNKNWVIKDIANTLIVLPPLAEQQRIVDKLEQILPLIEEYGKNEEKLSELNKTLPDKIKQSILQHAVQGKLVPQNPTDEPASELLKRIKSEKEQLIKDGKIKKEKPLPPITDDEIPYELPQGWEWVRIGAITDIGTGTTPPTSNREYYNGNINWISSSSTGNNYIIEPDKLISQKAVDECNLRIYNPDTLIIALYGQGKTRGQITQLKIPSCINQACAAICIINKNLLNLSYIKYFYKKQYDDIRSLAAGGAQPNLNVGKIKNTIIPIPPLAEQQRIVDKIEKLMLIVDKLER